MKINSLHRKAGIALFCLVLLLSLFTTETLGQQRDSTAIFRIETRDGNEYLGKIVEQTNDQLILSTEKLGTITIRMIEVVKIDEVAISQVKDHVYWFENPQSTRYLWSPNAYGLKRGEGYYQNIWVLFNQFSVGITDNISLGGGMIPLFLFGGLSTPAWFTPKVSIPIRENKLNMGVGGLLGGVIGEPDTGFGILYGMMTFGSRDRNLTVGLGYGYAGGTLANHPAISISGLIRTGARGYFITENYYLASADGSILLLSFGGRRIIKKTGLDFGLFIPSDAGSFLAIPWLGFTVPFGKKIGS